MTFASCVADLSYRNVVVDQELATNVCASAVPEFVIDKENMDSVSNRGWKMGQDYARLVSTGPAPAAQRMVTQIVMVGCMNVDFGYLMVEADTEYYYPIFDESSFGMRVMIRDCPNGGKTENPRPMNGITDCYVNTFSDTNGSGEYTEPCYYTE